MDLWNDVSPYEGELDAPRKPDLERCKGCGTKFDVHAMVKVPGLGWICDACCDARTGLHITPVAQ